MRELSLSCLFEAARGLAQFASYAEIVGGISVNCQEIRGYCDVIFAWLAEYDENPRSLSLHDLARWKSPSEYRDIDDVVQVLCEVTQPTTSDFPRACEMPVSSGDYGVGDLFVSIGWQDDDGEWHVAGWDMAQDCWTDARSYTVNGWQPIAPADQGNPSLQEGQ